MGTLHSKCRFVSAQTLPLERLSRWSVDVVWEHGCWAGCFPWQAVTCGKNDNTVWSLRDFWYLTTLILSHSVWFTHAGTHPSHLQCMQIHAETHVRSEYILRQRYRNTFWVGVCSIYFSIVWAELSLNYAIQRQVSVTKWKKDSRCSCECSWSVPHPTSQVWTIIKFLSIFMNYLLKWVFAHI